MQGELRLTDGRAHVGRSLAEKETEFGLLVEELLDAAGGVVDGEAGVGLSAHGVEDFLFGGALVGENAAVVDVGEAADVPGVRGMSSSALGGVAGEAFEGGGAEEVDLRPGAALDAVDRAGPGVGAVGAAVGAVTFDERPLELDGSAVAGQGVQAVVGDGGDGDDAPVVEPLPVGVDGAVDEEAVADGVVPFPGAPRRAGEFGAVDVSAGPEAGTDAVGEVLAVGMEDGEGDDAGGAVGGEVGDDRVGQGFPGGVGGAEVVLPAVVLADGLAGGDEPGSVAGQGLSFCRFELAPVLRQGWAGDLAAGREVSEFLGEAAGPDGLGLVGVAEAPEGGAGGGGDGGEDGLGVAGRYLGNLVEDDDGPGVDGGAVEGEAGDGHGRDAGLEEFAGGLVGGGESEDRVAGGRGGGGGGVDGGGLAESGRGDQGAQRLS